MEKPISVILLDNAKSVFEKLKETVNLQIASGKTSSFEMQLLRAIEQKFELLRKNPFYGNNVPKKLIPRIYNIQNLWRVELPNFWSTGNK